MITNFDKKMPAADDVLLSGSVQQLPSMNAQAEKPHHYTYLKEFRVDACPLFKQHQCSQHRPYTCFYWHFANQKRRRPIRRKDGTFNYSPDIYCTKYDENTGFCPDGDDCPYLHRLAGDVERKYHLRYYKTCLCVHGTDPKGNCTKNGAHCAFAHGPTDLRQPVHDIRELQTSDESVNGMNGEAMLESNRYSFVVDDPIWHNPDYVLAFYKTEFCKKPPRLCRQGYACPYYHNNKDRRRTPKTFKYRSTPCPAVKQTDEWSDPELCEQGEACTYCHTRTEQQFHPEIYKSTKCNDMLQHGYCPRGPFCAFAHHDNEIGVDRESTLKNVNAVQMSMSAKDANKQPSASPDLIDVMAVAIAGRYSGDSGTGTDSQGSSPGPISYSGAVKQRNANSNSRDIVKQASSGQLDQLSTSFPKAIGAERDTAGRHWSFGSNKDTLMMNMNGISGGISSGMSQQRDLNAFDALATGLSSMSFITNSTVENVVGNVLDDFTLDEFSLGALNEKEERQSPGTSSLNSHYTASSISLYGSSAPVTIPGSHGFTSGTAGLFGSSNNANQNAGSFGGSGTSATFSRSADQHCLFNMSGGSGSIGLTDFMSPTRHDTAGNPMNRFYEESIDKMKTACEQWKKEAEEYRGRLENAERDKTAAVQQRDDALVCLNRLRSDYNRIAGLSTALLRPDLLDPAQLEQLNNFLKTQMNQIESQLHQARSAAANGPICGRCGRQTNGPQIAGPHCPICSPVNSPSKPQTPPISAAPPAGPKPLPNQALA